MCCSETKKDINPRRSEVTGELLCSLGECPFAACVKSYDCLCRMQGDIKVGINAICLPGLLLQRDKLYEDCVRLENERHAEWERAELLASDLMEAREENEGLRITGGPCTTCGGAPPCSGRTCVCEGKNTMLAELDGLRRMVYDSRKFHENETRDLNRAFAAEREELSKAMVVSEDRRKQLCENVRLIGDLQLERIELREQLASLRARDKQRPVDDIFEAGRVGRAKLEANCILHRLEVSANFDDADIQAILLAADRSN
jgi:hypothetical protein